LLGSCKKRILSFFGFQLRSTELTPASVFWNYTQAKVTFFSGRLLCTFIAHRYLVEFVDWLNYQKEYNRSDNQKGNQGVYKLAINNIFTPENKVGASELSVIAGQKCGNHGYKRLHDAVKGGTYYHTHGQVHDVAA
jgi:hypothetical protein